MRWTLWSPQVRSITTFNIAPFMVTKHRSMYRAFVRDSQKKFSGLEASKYSSHSPSRELLPDWSGSLSARTGPLRLSVDPVGDNVFDGRYVNSRLLIDYNIPFITRMMSSQRMLFNSFGGAPLP